jgi:hypothetical protein
MITHHCSVCGTYVEEFCADHPKAQVISVKTPELTAAEAARLPEYLGQPVSLDTEETTEMHCVVCDKYKDYPTGTLICEACGSSLTIAVR